MPKAPKSHLASNATIFRKGAASIGLILGSSTAKLLIYYHFLQDQ